MDDFNDDFLYAFNHAMLYEVGGFWNPDDPAVQEGAIGDRSSCRKVGYVNDPDDAGGETKYGIAKNGNPDVDIATLDLVGAMDIYCNRYWFEGSCDKLPGAVAIIHFDGCVNHGVGRANKFLQSAVGAQPDGQIGPRTLDAVNSMDQEDIIRSIAQQRTAFYNAIVKAKPTQAKFLKGWLARINDVTNFALSKV